MTRQTQLTLAWTLLIVAVLAGDLFAQRGAGRGRGPGPRGPAARGGRQDPTSAVDHQVFQFLLANGRKINRKVTNLKNGIETLTESADPVVAVKIQEHVHAMYDRLDEKRPIHLRDPLFRELFQNADKITMKMELTASGIHVVETSEDPHVVNLLQKHAKVVSLFIKNGFAEVRKNH